MIWETLAVQLFFVLRKRGRPKGKKGK